MHAFFHWIKIYAHGIMSLRALLLFSLPLYIFTEMLERVSLSEEDALTCGQGIVDCEVETGACIGHDENVYVSGLETNVVQCQMQEKTWSLCLKILVNITVKDAVGQSVDAELAGDVSDDDKAVDVHEKAHRSVLYEYEDNTSAATVCVCYTYPSLSESKMLHFTFSSSVFDGGNTLQVWMSLVVRIREADLGSPVTVYSFCTNFTKQVTISTPSKEEVCSTDGDVVFCKDAPRLGKRTDRVTGAIKLYVDNAKERFQKFQACQKLEKDGKCLKVEWYDARQEFEISRNSIAPCLCFEIWGNFPRKVHCPFLNETVSDSNVSVSVSVLQIHNSMESDITALIWNLTSPCRLETELWLCRKDSSASKSCNRMNNMHHVHKFKKWVRGKDKWIRTDVGHWQLQGEFSKVERNSLLCVQVKIRGIDGYLGPVCPFEVKRWSVLLLVCVLLMCLSILGAHVFQGALKSWTFRWLKVDNMNRTAGSVEVLLVYPPDRDHEITELICHLSSSLSTLGFIVSMDLLNRSEINALGPIPWLHSHLDQALNRGGRAVLVLTQTTCERAKQWACRGEGEGENYEQKEGFQSSSCLDVFNASLSCILADYLQGQAGKRFMLAQFEGQSPVSVLTFPEFFHGLPLFSLPSQSLGFLMEVTHGVHKGRGMATRWMRSMLLSTAARALSGALHGLTGSTRHKSGTEDASGGVPQQQNQTTPQTNSAPYRGTIGWI